MATVAEILQHAGSWVGNDGRRRYVVREILKTPGKRLLSVWEGKYSLRMNLTGDELVAGDRSGKQYVIPGMGKYLPGSPNAPDWMPEVA